MKTKFKQFAAGALLAVASAASAANFPLGTQIVSGSVRNYLNELYPCDGNVRVQAADTNGNVLAECAVHRAVAGSAGENYLLEVPVTSVATGSSIAPGDPIRLYVIDGSELKVAAGTVSSPKSIDDVCVNLSVVDVTWFDSTSPYANELGRVAVANEYLDLWAAYADGRKYDPDADDDGDGATNYFEYLAGTNPFDESDFLAIRDFRLDAGQTAAITFEYVGGHVYTVLSSLALAKPSWTAEKTVLPAAAENEPGIATVFVLPTEKVPAKFFRIDPQ